MVSITPEPASISAFIDGGAFAAANGKGQRITAIPLPSIRKILTGNTVIKQETTK